MNVGVIGSGAMGSGIAQVASTADKASLTKIMKRLIEKGRLTTEKATQIQSNITYVNALSDFAQCDLVIEAIIENAEIKKNVFAELEGHVSPDCIIASNTSSLSITSLAAALQKPERFLGIHFFNPAPLMKLVEIIPALQTL